MELLAVSIRSDERIKGIMRAGTIHAGDLLLQMSDQKERILYVLAADICEYKINLSKSFFPATWLEKSTLILFSTFRLGMKNLLI